jgi:alpha-D-xyloside xylohydrolase
MKPKSDWDSFIAPFDYTTMHKKTNSLQRWERWEKTQAGLSLQCLTALGERARFQVDVIAPEVIRLRLSQGEMPARPSDMLLSQAWEPAHFEISATPEQVSLVTPRLRVELPCFPWGMRVYDRAHGDGALPFFKQQNEDRAYGPGYEVPPIGFEAGWMGRNAVRETVAVAPGEAFYGFGERFTPFNKWGQELTFWAIDSGNVTSYRAYKNIPFFISSAGYGVFVHSSNPMVFRMGSDSSISYSFHILSGQLDYFLIYGPSLKDVLRRYVDLTGRAPLPPKWSFGFWISRCMYMSQAEVEEVIDTMRRKGFPCDVINLDPYWMGPGPWCTYAWGAEAFPRPAEMLQRLRGQGVRVCLWITPYLPAGSAGYEEARQQGYLIHKPDGDISPILEAFTGDDLAAIDFTNPQACAWFQARLTPLLEMGVATFKTDFGEQAPVEARYADGRCGVEMHNLYPLLYNKTVFELTERQFGRGLVWGRSAYAGSQRYPVQWGGDSYSSLEQMAGQLRGLLGYGMSGVPFCGHDIGGFDYPPGAFDHPSQADYPRDTEVYLRWLQFGAFSSHCRAHGKQPREPWEYGAEAEMIAHKYLRLRYRLLPYIYSEAVRCSQSGLPMLRPLVLEYPSDPNTIYLDTQYLFGENILVAPLLTRSSRRLVYLPQGDWYDYWSKVILSGGRWIEVEAPLEKLPLFVKAGAILPMGPAMDYVDQLPLDPLTVELYASVGQVETHIYDEDKPPILIRYELRPNHLAVQIGAAPGQVELILYGLRARQAEVEGNPVVLETCPGGQALRFGASQGARVMIACD